MLKKPKLLILNLYMVYPPNSGAKVVIFNRLVQLSKFFDVTFCCLNEQESDFDCARFLSRFAKVVLVPYPAKKSSLLSRIYQQFRNPSSTDLGAKFYSWIESSEIKELVEHSNFDIIEIVSACWFHKIFLASKSKISLIALNSEGKYYTEKAKACIPIFDLKGFFRAIIDSVLVSLQENRAVASADIIISVFPPTTANRLFDKRGPAVNVVENCGGIDLAYYSNNHIETVSLESYGHPRLLFISTMFVESSVEAVLLFAKDILPLIKDEFSNVEFWVVGDHRNNSDLLNLAVSNSSVKLFGLVEDTRVYLAAADIVVVPILHGSGVRYKILEALAAGKAVVSTAKGAEGLKFNSAKELLITKTAQEMAQAILSILNDSNLKERFELEAKQAVIEKYDSQKLLRKLAKDYYQLLNIKSDLIG